MNQPPFDPNEGFGPVVIGCVLLAAVVGYIAVAWITGGAR